MVKSIGDNLKLLNWLKLILFDFFDCHTFKEY